MFHIITVSCSLAVLENIELRSLVARKNVRVDPHLKRKIVKEAYFKTYLYYCLAFSPACTSVTSAYSLPH